MARTALASLSAGSQTVTASFNDYALSVPITFLPGPPDAAGMGLLARNSNVVADGNAKLNLLAFVGDTFGNPLLGQTVAIASNEPSDVWSSAASPASVGPDCNGTLALGPAVVGTSDSAGGLAASLQGVRAGSRQLSLCSGGVVLQQNVTLVAGPLALGHSALTLQPNQVAADNVSVASFAVVARDAHDNPLANLAVLPGLSTSGATFVPASGATDATGAFSGTVRSGVAGAQVLTVYVGSGGKRLQAPLTFVAGPPQAAQSTLVASPNAQVADGTSACSVTAVLRDALQNPVAGANVVLQVTDASGGANPNDVLGASFGTTDASGTFSTTLAARSAGPRTVLATAAGLSLTTTLTFVPGPIDAGASSFVASPNRVVADGNAAMDLQVTARDAMRNPVPGAQVALSSTGSDNTFGAASGVTDANGMLTTNLRSRVAQPKQLTATFDQATSVSVTASFTAGPASAAYSSLQVNPNQATAGSSVSVRANVRDAYGNAVTGKAMSFAADDNQATFSPQQANTSPSGTASSTFVAILAGQKQLSASDGNVVLVAQVTYAAAEANGQVTNLVASPNVQVADDDALVALTLQVVDAYGNPAAGQNVTLTSDNVDGNDTFDPPSGTLNAQGFFTASLRSNRAETKHVSFVSGAATGDVNVTFVAGDPNAARSQLSATPNSVVADDVTQASVQVLARDAFGNPVGDYPVSLSASSANATFASTGGNTAADGTFVTGVHSGRAQATTITASLQSAASLNAPLTFVAGPASPTASHLSVAPAGVVADGVAAATVTLQVVDEHNNPVAGVGALLQVDGNALFDAPTGTTDAAGKYVTGLRSTQSGNHTVQASFNGQAGPQATASFVAGSPNASVCTLIAPAATVADGVHAAAIVAAVRDRFGNPVVGQALALSVDGNGAVLDQNVGVTDANGTFATGLRSTVAQNRIVGVNVGGVGFSGGVPFVAGAPVVARSSLSASPNALVANNVSQSTLAVQLADAYGNVAGKQNVHVASLGQGDTVAAPDGTTDDNGAYVTTVQSTVAESKTLQASFAGGNVTTTLVTTPGSPNAASTTLVPVPSSQVADNYNVVVLTATVRDRFGNVVPGQATSLVSSNAYGNDTINPASQVTDANGRATYLLRSSRAENKTLTLTAASASVTAGVTFVAGQPNATQSQSSVAPASIVADNVATAQWTVTLRDKFKNPADNVTLALVGSAPDVTFSPAAPVTDANGKASIAVRGTVVGTKVLRAGKSSTALVTSANVTLSAGPPSAAHTVLTLSPNTFAADAAIGATASAVVRDAFDNAVPGASVAWSVIGAASSTSPTASTTDASGSCSTQLVSTAVGSKTVVATLATAQNVSVAATVVAAAPNPNTTTLTASPNQQVADNSNTLTLTGILRDAYNNLVGGAAATFYSSNTLGNDTFSPRVTTSDANGLVRCTLRSNRAQAKQISVATTGGNTTTGVTFVAGRPSLAQSSMVASPNVGIGDGSSVVQVGAIVRDAYTNPVAGAQVALNANGTSLSFTPVSKTSDASGYAGSMALISGTLGDKQMSGVISLGNTTYGTITRTLSFSGGPPAAASTTLSWSSTTGGVYGNPNIVVTLQAQDANGRPSGYQRVVLASTQVADQFSVGAGGQTDVNGAFRSTLAATLAGPRTLTATMGPLHWTQQVSFSPTTPFCSSTPLFGVAPMVVVPGTSNVTAGAVPAAELADLDHDGHADLLALNQAQNALHTYRSLGNGNFSLWATYPLGCSPNALVARDLTHDGYVDAAVGCADANVVLVLRNDTTGNLVASTTPDFGAATAGLAAGALTSGGNVDLVTFGPAGYVGLYLNDGAGNFALAAHPYVGNDLVALAVGDMTGDGVGDVVASLANSNAVVLLPGNGLGQLGARRTLLTLPSPGDVALGYFNGDAALDLAVKSNVDANDVVAFNQGDGTGGVSVMQLLPTGGAGTMRAVDLDGDGAMDLVNLRLTSVSQLTYARNDGYGNFNAIVLNPYFPAAPAALSFGDVDGDGHLDVSIAAPYGVISVQRATGAGTFDGPTLLSTGPQGVSLQVADFDGDGVMDVSGPVNARLYTVFGVGDGTFARQSIVNPVPLTNSPTPNLYRFTAAPVDVDGDGSLDMVAVSDDPNAYGIMVWRNNGKGFFDRQVFTPANGEGYSPALADFDGDGIVDALLPSAYADSNVLFLKGVGDGSFVLQSTFNVHDNAATATRWIKVADFNNDGLPDALVTFGGVASRVLLGHGDGTFTNVTSLVIGSSGEPMVRDLNQDGNLDVAYVGYSSGFVSALGAGDGTFGPATVLPFPTLLTNAFQYLSAADVNGDGYVDAITTSDQSSALAVLLGDGAGNFRLGGIYPSGGKLARGVGTVDADGDGRYDVVIATGASRAMTLLFNRGCL